MTALSTALSCAGRPTVADPVSVGRLKPASMPVKIHPGRITTA